MTTSKQKQRVTLQSNTMPLIHMSTYRLKHYVPSNTKLMADKGVVLLSGDLPELAKWLSSDQLKDKKFNWLHEAVTDNLTFTSALNPDVAWEVMEIVGAKQVGIGLNHQQTAGPHPTPHDAPRFISSIEAATYQFPKRPSGNVAEVSDSQGEVNVDSSLWHKLYQQAVQASEHCDFKLVAACGTEFPVHRCVLACGSPVFTSLMSARSASYTENKLGQMKIHNASALGLFQLRKCLYDDNYKFTLDLDGNQSNMNVLDELLELSEEYELKRLKNAIQDALLSTVSPCSAARLLTLAENFNLDKVKNAVTKALYNFESDKAVSCDAV